MRPYSHTHPCRSMFVHSCIHTYAPIVTQCTHVYICNIQWHTFHILGSLDNSYRVEDQRPQASAQEHWQKQNPQVSAVRAPSSPLLWLQESWQSKSPTCFPWLTALGPQRRLWVRTLDFESSRTTFQTTGGRQKIARLVPIPMRSPLFPLPCTLTMLLITWPAVGAHVGVHCSESYEGTARTKRT